MNEWLMLLFTRSLIYITGQVLSAIVIGIVALFFFFSVSLRSQILLQWARFNIWTLKVICGIQYRVKGAENIPDVPSVIISNHQSAWETLCFQNIFPLQSYLIKRELLWIPFFGWGLALNRPVPIDRSKKNRALQQLISQGMKRLQEGRWLVIFPEGSRMKPGHPARFQSGGAMIASKFDCPVVPVCHNAGVFWPKRGFLKYPGVIDICIGPTILPEGRKVRELNREVESWIKTELQTLPDHR